MTPLLTKFRPLLPQHYESLRSHIKKLSDDDRLQLFGSQLSKEAIDIWVKNIQWDQTQLFGAWLLDKFNRESELIGILQLEPMNKIGTYELSISVLPLFRKQGIATSMLANLMRIKLKNPIEQLIAFNGHLALVSIINSIGLEAYFSTNNSKVLIPWQQSSNAN